MRKRMDRRIDITGKKYGRLTAIKRVDHSEVKDRDRYKWLCECQCGKFIEVPRSDLKSGHIKSCGCLNTEKAKEQGKKAIEKYIERNCKEGTSLSKINNPKLLKNNKSGVTGVFFDNTYKKWVATIEFKGKKKRLGSFKEKEDAIKARKEGEEKYFKPAIEKILKDLK